MHMAIRRVTNFLVYLSLLTIGCSRQPEYSASEIASCGAFIRTDTGQVLDDNLSCQLSSGYWVEFDVEVSSTRPEECSDPLQWQCVLVFFDPTQADSEPSYWPCASLNPVEDPINLPAIWLKAGPQVAVANEILRLAPKIKSKLNSTTIPFYGLIGPPFEKAGEFPYELQLYPFYRRTENGGQHPGNPVVIARGILIVKE